MLSLTVSIARADGVTPTLPSQGRFVAGSGAIGAVHNGLVIDQSSTRGIIDWQSFSIGAGKIVQINNGSGATLNRVVGADLSSIAGTLKGSGSVYLVNPNGVLVMPNGQVITGGSFVASSRDVTNGNFMAGGALSFSGATSGAVVNQGAIRSEHGDVFLIGQSARNEGSIEAADGTAGLAAGEAVLLRPADADERLFISAGTGDATNTGSIAAASAELKAAGGNVYALAGNNGGVIRATGTTVRDGHVWLVAGGGVTVSGTVSARDKNGSGGTIVATGASVALEDGAVLDASGTAGGIVLVGGDRQGGKDPAGNFVSAPVRTAGEVSVADGAVIDVTGSAGAGGNAVVWSDGHTEFAGLVAATGSEQGNGGFVETSGHTIDFTGARIEAGNWLIDPVDLTIDSAAALTIGRNLDTTDVEVMTSATGSSGPGIVTPGSGDILVRAPISWNSSHTLTLSAYRNVQLFRELSMVGSVVLRADNTGTGVGRVYFNDGAKVVGGGTGTVDIYFNPESNPAGSAVNGTSYGGLSGYAANMAGGVVLTEWSLVNTVFDLQNIRNVPYRNYALGRDIDASATTGWDGGAGFSPIFLYPLYNGTPEGTPRTGMFNGLGHAIDGLYINQPTRTEVGLFATMARGTVVKNLRLTNITVKGYRNVGGLTGLNEGMILNSSVSGTVTGIDGVGLNYMSMNIGGLVGNVESTGRIEASSSSATVVGANEVGGLVGYSKGYIKGSSSSAKVTATYTVAGGLVGMTDGGSGGVESSTSGGVVTAPDYAGGLVGFNGEVIYSSSSSATVSGRNNIGGLVGYMNNASAVEGSHSSGTVTGTSGSIGGLVGGMEGNANIGRSYSTSTVTGGDFVGGLVGLSYGGSVDESYATGNVKGASSIGGLVGSNTNGAWVSRSFASGSVTGKQSIGGLVGYNDAHVDRTYATGAVTGTTFYAGGLVGYNPGGTVTQSYSAGKVTGVNDVGGLVGLTNAGGTVSSDSYWDKTTSGRTTSAGGTGLTTAQMQAPSAMGTYYANWNFNADWSPPGAGYYPQLFGVSHVLRVHGGENFRNYGSANPALSIIGYYGLQNGDTADIIVDPVLSTSATVNSNVGNYAITGTGGSAVGLDGTPYRLVFGGSVIVTPVTLTYTASAASRTYGGSNPAFSGSLSGFVLGQTQATATTGTVSWTTTAPSSSNVGNYAINGGGLTANNGNYIFAQAPGNATALKINPATLTYVADAKSRAYGAADPAFSGTVTGFVLGQTQSGATTGTLGWSTNATASSSVGSYAINGGGLAAKNGNYVFVQAASNTAALKINPAVLTYAADAKTRTYGAANPAITGKVTGFVLGQMQASETTGTATWKTTATTSSNVGTYGVTGSGLTSKTANYVFAQAPTNASTFKIVPASLVYTATAKSRRYGSANPTLTGTLSGFVLGQTQATATTGIISWKTTATSSSNVGSYAITGSGLTARNGNYAFVQAPGNVKALTITPATLTYTATPKTRKKGQPNPLLTGSVSGFVLGQTLSTATTGTAVWTTPATVVSSVGSYAINGSGLAAKNGNYVFVQAPGNARALTVK